MTTHLADAYRAMRLRVLAIADIVTEPTEKGAVLDEILGNAGSLFPSNFFLDAWTHEWDLRPALQWSGDPGPVLSHA